MIGFDLRARRRARRSSCARSREQRLIMNATGPQTVRLLPPLTISDAEVDEALARLAACSPEPRRSTRRFRRR